MARSSASSVSRADDAASFSAMVASSAVIWLVRSVRCGGRTLACRSSSSFDLPTLLAVDGVREARTGREVVEIVRGPMDARSAGAPPLARLGLSAPLAVRAVVAAGGLLAGERTVLVLLAVRAWPSAGRVVGATVVRAVVVAGVGRADVDAGVGRADVVAGRTGGLLAAVEARLARARAVVGAAGLRGVVVLPASGLRAAVAAVRLAAGDLTPGLAAALAVAEVVGPGAGSGASADTSALSGIAGGPGVAVSSVATRECVSSTESPMSRGQRVQSGRSRQAQAGVGAQRDAVQTRRSRPTRVERTSAIQ